MHQLKLKEKRACPVSGKKKEQYEAQFLEVETQHLSGFFKIRTSKHVKVSTCICIKIRIGFHSNSVTLGIHMPTIWESNFNYNENRPTRKDSGTHI